MVTILWLYYCFFLASFTVGRARCKWTGRNIGIERFTVHVFAKTFNLKIHVVIWQTTFKEFSQVRAARAARLFFVIQPIRSLFSSVVVTVAVTLAIPTDPPWGTTKKNDQRNRNKTIVTRTTSNSYIAVIHYHVLEMRNRQLKCITRWIGER